MAQAKVPSVFYHGEEIGDRPLFIGCSAPISALLSAIWTKAPTGKVTTSEDPNEGKLVANFHATEKYIFVNFATEVMAAKIVPLIKLFRPKRIIIVTTVSYEACQSEIPPPFLARVSTDEIKEQNQIPHFLDIASSAALLWCVSHTTRCQIMALFQEQVGPTTNSMCEVAAEIRKAVEFDVHATVEKALATLQK